MKHSNIAIFVPHAGCPNACSFCNQKTITEQSDLPRAADVGRICAQAMQEVQDPRHTEVAFFGGSFTAIPQDYMLELLDAVQPFLGENGFSGIRISTRPDCIDTEVLALLKDRGVTAIELGAQSMCDHVLAANDRGHTAQDVVNACLLIRESGIKLGLQMMVGLYRSRMEDETATIRQFLGIHPDMVRIYPVAVLRGTKLAQLYENGEYSLFSFEETVGLCADAMESFQQSGIRVIKCGLHASEFVEKDCIAGFYHPAFREICESRMFRKKIAAETAMQPGSYRILVHPSCISKAVGHGRENISYFAQHGICVKIIGDEQIPKFKCKVKEP